MPFLKKTIPPLLAMPFIFTSLREALASWQSRVRKINNVFYCNILRIRQFEFLNLNNFMTIQAFIIEFDLCIVINNDLKTCKFWIATMVLRPSRKDVNTLCCRLIMNFYMVMTIFQLICSPIDKISKLFA